MRQEAQLLEVCRAYPAKAESPAINFCGCWMFVISLLQYGSFQALATIWAVNPSCYVEVVGFARL